MKKLLLLAMSICMALFVSCSKDEDSPANSVNNDSGITDYSFVYAVHNVSSNSAVYILSVEVPDNNNLQELGVCWGTNAAPRINSGNYLTSENDGTSATFTVENLTPGTHYYICGFFNDKSVSFHDYPAQFLFVFTNFIAYIPMMTIQTPARVERSITEVWGRGPRSAFAPALVEMESRR